MPMLDGYAADLERYLSQPDRLEPQCECGATLDTYWDTDDHGGKRLIVQDQDCADCGKHTGEHRA